MLRLQPVEGGRLLFLLSLQCDYFATTKSIAMYHRSPWTTLPSKAKSLMRDVIFHSISIAQRSFQTQITSTLIAVDHRGRIFDRRPMMIAYLDVYLNSWNFTKRRNESKEKEREKDVPLPFIY